MPDASFARHAAAIALLAALLMLALMPALGEPWVQPAQAPAPGDETAGALAVPDADDAPATAQTIAVLLGEAPPATAATLDGPLGELPLAGLQRLVLAEGQRLGSPVDHALFVPRPPAAGDAPLLVDMAIDALNQAPSRDLLQALAAPPPWPLLVAVVLVIAVGVLVAQHRRHARRRHRSGAQHPYHHEQRHRHPHRLRAPSTPGVPAPQDLTV